MVRLKPITIIVGEGASGGALGMRWEIAFICWRYSVISQNLVLLFYGKAGI
jgi:acetyl-CoA carboxylase alpha subunit